MQFTENTDMESAIPSNQNCISVGCKFTSYDELTIFLKNYEQTNKQKFYKVRSRTIEAAKRIIQRKLKDSLKFYEIHYGCIHGKERAKRGNGLRKSSSLRMGCGAFFKLRICSTGDNLTIYSANLNHSNHDLSTNVFEHLYQNRALNNLEIEKVKTYLTLGANKKKIQNNILLETGKLTTLKDLHNLHYKIKIGKNDLEEVVRLLETKYRCNVHILCDEDDNFKALQFTTENMRNAISAWPEFVSVDGTYKLIDIGCTVFLFVVEDSNGQAEIACVSLLSTEDRDTYQWVFETFKNEMDTDKIRCFMGDKDLLERDVIKEIFPGTPVYLCLFHTLKTFRREIQCEKLNISKQERDLSLEYLQKLAYSSTEDEYLLLYSQFKEYVPQNVSNYFDKNWHNIRSEWRVWNMTEGNLKNTTNNRIESINQKIKQVVQKNSTLIEFVKNFFIFVQSNNQERDNKAADHILKKSLRQFEDHENDMRLYSDLLTNYSFNYVLQQVTLIQRVKIVSEYVNGIFELEISQGKIYVTQDSCQCVVFCSMMLPCSHILAVRDKKQIPLFSKTLCHERWTKEYYLSKQRIGKITSSSIAPPSCTVKAKKRIMTLTEKRKNATIVTSSLVNSLSITSDSEYLYKMELLKKLDDMWKVGREVTLIETDKAYDDLEYIIAQSNPQTISEVAIDSNLASSEITNTIDSVTNIEEARCCEELNCDVDYKDGNINNTEGNLIDQNQNNYINAIVLPKKTKKRGRPKGHEVTVVGLRKKRTTNARHF